MGARCMWCGETLVFSRGKGWVHPDGKIYKTRMKYPGFCRACGHPLLDGYCYKCSIQYRKEEVDDHCALPVRV